MGWIVALLTFFAFVWIVRRSLDRETTTNLALLAKLFAAAVLAIFVIGIFRALSS